MVDISVFGDTMIRFSTLKHAGHVITGNFNGIPDARVRNIISKGPKYRFLSNIDFPQCRREIAASLNDLSNR